LRQARVVRAAEALNLAAHDLLRRKSILVLRREVLVAHQLSIERASIDISLRLGLKHIPSSWIEPKSGHRLNVGGSHFDIDNQILYQVKGLFTYLTSGRWDHTVLKDKENRIFLDYDPAWFESILEVLRYNW
jgi:hypothetical protein